LGATDEWSHKSRIEYGVFPWLTVSLGHADPTTGHPDRNCDYGQVMWAREQRWNAVAVAVPGLPAPLEWGAKSTLRGEDS